MHDVKVPADFDAASMTGDLARLVAVESFSRDPDGLAAHARLVADYLTEMLGSPAELIESPVGPHVRWSGGGDPRVLVLGHHDTVHPPGTAAARPFAVADGVATGPGVFDMKAGIVQAVHAVASLDDRSAIEIILTADEETGSRTSRSLIEERARACGAVLVLEPSADGGHLKTARKGTGTFLVEVHGRASHAGLEPEKGVNALVVLASLVPRVAALADTGTGTTVTPTLASAGTADNVVPDLATFTVDVRVENPAEKERIEAAMAALAGTDGAARVEVRGGIGRPPMHPSASVGLMDIAREVAGACGIGSLEGVAVGGGSDGNFTAAAGVQTLDGLGAVGGGAHAADEHVVLAEMPRRAALLAGICQRLSGMPSRLGPVSVPA